MEQTLSAGRPQISAYAPRLFKLKIPQDKIRDLIGPGGKKIRSIIEATGVKIDVLEDGTVHIFSTSGAGGDAALQMVRDVTASAEIGKTISAKSFVSRSSAPSSSFSRAPMASCTSANLRTPHPRRSRRAETRRPGPRQGPLHRGQQVRLSRKALIKEAREKQQKAAGGGGTSPRRRRLGGDSATTNKLSTHLSWRLV